MMTVKNDDEEIKEVNNVSDDMKEKSIVAQVEKSFGRGSIMLLEKQSLKTDIPTISTGALSLDLALGVNGLPRGRIIEIFGPESSGKTTLCLHVIANAQKKGGACAIIDAEHALDPTYAKKIGVTVDKLLLSQPDCGEDALNMAEYLIRTNNIDVLVIDSVAALTPRAEIEGQMGDSHMGLHARLMSQALRKITGIVHKTKTCIIFTNQIRSKIGVIFGSAETTTGGNALKFYSSIRLDLRRISAIKNSDGETIGSRVRAKVVKNKMAPPFKNAEFDVNFSEGISRSGSILDVAIEMNIMEKKGSWLSFKGKQVGQGRETVKDILKSNQELENEILEEIIKKVKSKI